MVKIADFEIESLVVDQLSLDGGAMFGSVPKTLWSKRIEPDERNRIPLSCRLLKIKHPVKSFLVDLGCGSKWSPKLRDIYNIQNLVPLPVDIKNIILTHLHFDHGGGISSYNSSGEVQPFTENLTVYLNSAQWEHCQNREVRDKASFIPENIDPLKMVKLELTFDGEELLPGLSLHQADGHTRGLQWIKCTDGQKTLAFPSDLIPTAHHLDLPYIMGYDLSAECSLKEKKHFLEAASAGNWLIVFEHDTETAAAKIKLEKSGKVSITEKQEF